MNYRIYISTTFQVIYFIILNYLLTGIYTKKIGWMKITVAKDFS